MRFKPMMVLTSGVMSLIGLSAGVAIALSPMQAQAQTANSTEQWAQVLEQLDLTADQQTQLAQIGDNARLQLETLLTSEQREQFRTTLEQGNNLQAAIAAMNLTSEQQSQLQSIFETARQEAALVLTEEQRQRARELLQERLQPRQ